MIDLRSDTVTLPTPAMFRASAAAELGDDVYGEDPTVIRLERATAERLGKEAGLFLPSGTMGNLCAMLAHCARGSRVVVGTEAHIFQYEAGGSAVAGGLMLHALPNTEDGDLDLATVKEALESPEDAHVAPAGLLAIENTHNRCGGKVLDPARVKGYADVAHAAGVPLHVDGARIFNAAVALGVQVRTLVEAADSVQLCFSKGLAAPAGSMLVGSAPFIRRAWRQRKLLGGGMRQAGVLAAMCQVALDEMVDRLAEDHANARRLAEGMREALGADFDVPVPASNIVIVKVKRGPRTLRQIETALRGEGVKVGMIGPHKLRAVTHFGIADAEIDATLRAVAKFAKA